MLSEGSNINVFFLLFQYPIMFQGTAVAPEKLDLLKEVVGWVEDFVKYVMKMFLPEV